MWKKTVRRTLITAMAAGIGLAGLTACDPPEEADAPVSDQADETDEADESAEQQEPGGTEHAELELEAPDEPTLDQPPGDNPMAGAPPQMDADISDEDLDNFAEAVDAIEEIQDDLEARITEAEQAGPEEQRRAHREVMREAEQAVEDTGMDPMTMEAVIQQLPHDQELQDRVDDHDELELDELMMPAPPQQQQQQPPGGAPPPPGGGDAPELPDPEDLQ